MESGTIDLNAPPASRLLLRVSEDEMLFYRRFVERHGGAFEAVRQPVGGYRLDFPPGTRIVTNDAYDLRDSYRLLYPDGAFMTWYRMIKLDRRWLWDVLLVPVPDDDDWALFERYTPPVSMPTPGGDGQHTSSNKIGRTRGRI